MLGKAARDPSKRIVRMKYHVDLFAIYGRPQSPFALPTMIMGSTLPPISTTVRALSNPNPKVIP
jgi:hypothetical protein